MPKFRDNMTGAVVTVSDSAAQIYDGAGYTRINDKPKAGKTAPAKKTATRANSGN